LMTRCSGSNLGHTHQAGGGRLVRFWPSRPPDASSAAALAVRQTIAYTCGQQSGAAAGERSDLVAERADHVWDVRTNYHGRLGTRWVTGGTRRVRLSAAFRYKPLSVAVHGAKCGGRTNQPHALCLGVSLARPVQGAPGHGGAALDVWSSKAPPAAPAPRTSGRRG
jgi:hypothetical protein